MRKVFAISALLGSVCLVTAVHAAPVPVTMVSVGSYSKSAASASPWTATGANTATWTFDVATNTLAIASGTYARVAKVGSTPLMTHTMTGVSMSTGTAVGSTWTCTEGVFGGIVGAHICGNYGFGADFMNDSTYNQSTPNAVSVTVTLGGDDTASGPPQTLANSYSNFAAATPIAGAAAGFQRYAFSNGEDLIPGAGDSATGFDTGYVFSFDVAVLPTTVQLTLVADNTRSGSAVLSYQKWATCADTSTTAPCISTTNSWTLANQTGSTATWAWNGTTLTATGMFQTTAHLSSNPNGMAVISDKSVDLVINTGTMTTEATSYTCIEGNFLVNVGATGCLNTSTGDDFVNDSSALYNVGGDASCVQRTVGGDDVSTGNPRGLMSVAAGGGCDPIDGAYNLWTIVKDETATGGELILSNGIDIAAAGTHFMTFEVVTPVADAVDDGPVDVLEATATPINVGANDVNFSDPVTVTITTNPTKGSVPTISASGSAAGQNITYTSTVGATGADSFVYSMTDGINTDTATVNVIITASGANDDGPVTVVQAIDAVIPVGVNDTGFTDPVAVTVTTQPQYGTITAISTSGTAASQTITYTANAGYIGPDSFVYTMNDGTRSDTGIVTISVIAPPLSSQVPATLLSVESYAERSTALAPWTVTGADTSTWTFDLVNNTLAMSGGTYSRLARVGATPLMTHTMTGAALSSGAADANTWACIEGVFGGVIGAHICGNYDFGSNFTNESIYTPSTIAATVTRGGDDILIGDPQTLVNSYSGFKLAMPVAGAPAGFQRYAFDSGQDLVPGKGDNLTGFDIGYRIIFDVPAAPPPAEAADDGPVTVQPTATAIIPVGINDTGFVGPVTVSVTTAPLHGSITAISLSGTAASQTISYTAAAGYFGTDSFAYSMTDGTQTDTATVSVTIPAPDAANDGPITATQGVATVIPVGANDNGFSDPVSVTITTLPTRGMITAISSAGAAATRTITYTANTGYTGPDSFTYRISDGANTDTATVAINIVVDYTPGAKNDTATTSDGQPVVIEVRNNDVGFTWYSTVLNIFTNPQHGSAIVNGSPGYQTISYTPFAGFTGIDTFSYVIDDGVRLGTAMVTIAVVADADRDGVDDGRDNCLGAANPGQQDADGDGFGNWCDADFNNDGRVNFADLAELRAKFSTTDPGTDLDSNGRVNFADLARMKALFGKPPGPSALVP